MTAFVITMTVLQFVGAGCFLQEGKLLTASVVAGLGAWGVCVLLA